MDSNKKTRTHILVYPYCLHYKKNKKQLSCECLRPRWQNLPANRNRNSQASRPRRKNHNVHGTIKSYYSLQTALRRHPGNICAERPVGSTCPLIAIETPKRGGQKRRTTLYVGTINFYDFLQTALRLHPGNMCAERNRKSPA